MGLYVENQNRFTSAVTEFVGFYFQSTLDDITSTKPRYSPCLTPMARYDNLPLYLVNGKGKIGLIDLERFTPTCKRDDENWCALKCMTAIYLFPYHFETILAAAKTFDPEIDRYRKVLERHRDSSLDYFKIVYEDHRKFVQEKNIGTGNPIEFAPIAHERLDVIQTIVKSQIYPLGQGEPLFEDLSPAVFARLEAKFPEILELIFDFIAKGIHSNSIRLEQPIHSYSQVLAVRTVEFNLRPVFEGISFLLKIDNIDQNRSFLSRRS